MPVANTGSLWPQTGRIQESRKRLRNVPPCGGHFWNRPGIPEALEHFQAAVKADPNYDRAWYEIGFTWLRQNKLAEAQRAFEQVIRLNPNDYEAQGSLGSVYMQKGDLDQAEGHLRAALRLNPDDQVARANLERVLSVKSNSRRSHL